MNINPITYNNYSYVRPSFKSNSPVNTRVLKDLSDVSCVYCGEKMLTTGQVDIFATKAAKLNGKKLYKYLSTLEKYMKPNEKKVLRVIKEGIKKNPDLSLQEVLQEMFPYHLGKLEKAQKSVLKQIEKLSKSFCEADKNLTLMQVYKGLVDIRKSEVEKHFKTNIYISEFYKLKERYTNKEDFKKIENIIRNMPNSHTNISAFIVKFSRKSSKEIATRLLSPSQSTIEHLLPHSLGGTRILSNIVLACGDDNSRRGNKPLDTMPQLRTNIHHYFRTLRHAMAKKLPIQDCLKVEEYILNIQKTINSMLEKPIRFDNSTDGIH